MGVRLDARRDAQQDPRTYAALLGHEGEAGKFLEGVDDEPADPVVESAFELGGGLVVAVEDDAVGRHAGALGDRELTAGADVETEAGVDHPSRDRDTKKCLTGVIDVAVAERVAPLRASAQ